jgi:drug/metabolite transporter (DMT)-like permease
LFCTVVMGVLASSVALSRLLVAYPTLTGQAMRYAVGAAGLAVLVRLSGRGGPRPRIRPGAADLARLLALAATGLAGFNFFLIAALRHADAAIVGTVVAGTPLVLAVLGPALRRGRPSPRLLAAAGVAVAGAALVYGGGHADPVGLAAAGATLAGEVSFSLLAVPLLDRLGPARVSAWSCALAVPLLAAAAVVAGEPTRWRPPTAAEAGALAYIAVVVTALAFPVWYAGVHRLGVERAGMFAALLPVATLAVAAALDRRAPAASQVVGVVVVAAGLAIALAPRRTRRPGPRRTGPASRRLGLLPLPIGLVPAGRNPAVRDLAAAEPSDHSP